MKCLVAVDNTKSSTAAVNEALNRSSVMDEKIIFVSCTEHTETVKEDMLVKNLDQNQKSSEKALQDAEEKAADYNVDVETRKIECDTVVEGLLRAINDEQPDFVYVGHRQLDPNDEYPVSSVARKLISKSPVPVTVVTNGPEQRTTSTTQEAAIMD